MSRWRILLIIGLMLLFVALDMAQLSVGILVGVLLSTGFEYVPNKFDDERGEDDARPY